MTTAASATPPANGAPAVVVPAGWLVFRARVVRACLAGITVARRGNPV